MKHDDLLYQDEVYQIIGCAMKVHSILGPGFHESVYKEALAYEFTRNNIPFVQEQILGMKWLNKLIGSGLSSLGLDIGTRIGGSVNFFLYL